MERALTAAAIKAKRNYASACKGQSDAEDNKKRESRRPREGAAVVFHKVFHEVHALRSQQRISGFIVFARRHTR